MMQHYWNNAIREANIEMEEAKARYEEVLERHRKLNVELWLAARKMAIVEYRLQCLITTSNNLYDVDEKTE